MKAYHFRSSSPYKRSKLPLNCKTLLILLIPTIFLVKTTYDYVIYPITYHTLYTDRVVKNKQSSYSDFVENFQSHSKSNNILSTNNHSSKVKAHKPKREGIKHRMHMLDMYRNSTQIPDRDRCTYYNIKGIPKSGTLWLNIIVNKILYKVCHSYPEHYACHDTTASISAPITKVSSNIQLVRHSHSSSNGQSSEQFSEFASHEDMDNNENGSYAKNDTVGADDFDSATADTAHASLQLGGSASDSTDVSGDTVVSSQMANNVSLSDSGLNMESTESERCEILGDEGREEIVVTGYKKHACWDWKNYKFFRKYKSLTDLIAFNDVKFQFDNEYPTPDTSILEKYEDWCTIVIFRDPRDAAVSKSHWTQGNNVDPNPYVREHFKVTIHFLNKWWNNFRKFENLDPFRVFTIFYEDLKRDTLRQVERLVNFMGLSCLLSTDDLEDIVASTSMHKLQTGDNQHHFRKGNACGFRNELNASIIEYVNSYMNATLKEDLLDKFHSNCP